MQRRGWNDDDEQGAGRSSRFACSGQAGGEALSRQAALHGPTADFGWRREPSLCLHPVPIQAFPRRLFQLPTAPRKGDRDLGDSSDHKVSWENTW